MEKQTLKDALLALNASSEGVPKSKTELGIIAPMWWKMLKHMKDEDFMAALDIVVQENKYFPAPSSILRAHRTRINRVPMVPAIEHNYISDEQREKNKTFLRQLRKKLAANLAMGRGKG